MQPIVAKDLLRKSPADVPLKKPFKDPCPFNVSESTLTSTRVKRNTRTGIGISIVIGMRWRAWRLRADWSTLWGKKDIGWAEAISFELLIHATDVLLDRPADLILHGDNTGILDGWCIGRHRNHVVNTVFKSIHAFLNSAQYTRSVTPCYIASTDNPADPLSRGIYGPTHLLLPHMVIPEHTQDFLTDATNPLSVCELWELREGRYSASASRTFDHLRARQQEAECA